MKTASSAIIPNWMQRDQRRSHFADDPAGQPRSWRVQGSPHLAQQGADDGRAVPVLRSDGAGASVGGRGDRRAAASAHQSRHRHLSVRGCDRSPRFARHVRDDRARRGQPDDGGHRASSIRSARRRPSARTAPSYRASRPGSRCPTTRKRWTPAFEHVARGDLPVVEDDMRQGARDHGVACGVALRRRRPMRARSMPISCLTGGGAIPIDADADERALYRRDRRCRARRHGARRR